MATNFTDLKNQSAKLDKIKQSMQANQKSYKDARFWEPTIDQTGTGFAVIRFLPETKGDELPYLKFMNHGFKSKINGKWFIENCPSTIGLPCPVCESVSEMFNGLNKNEGSGHIQPYKAKKRFYTNIYVISDPKNPETEGRVFLYKCPLTVFEKIKQKIEPKFEDELSMNPFDFWNGANFKLKIRNKEGFRNYDLSEFEYPAPLFDNDDDIAKVWHSQYNLSEFTKESNFKSYDELVRNYISATRQQRQTFTQDKVTYPQDESNVNEHAVTDDLASYAAFINVA
jgi:hypothetical protein